MGEYEYLEPPRKDEKFHYEKRIAFAAWNARTARLKRDMGIFGWRRKFTSFEAFWKSFLKEQLS